MNLRFLRFLINYQLSLIFGQFKFYSNLNPNPVHCETVREKSQDGILRFLHSAKEMLVGEFKIGFLKIFFWPHWNHIAVTAAKAQVEIGPVR